MLALGLGVVACGVALLCLHGPSGPGAPVMPLDALTSAARAGRVASIAFSPDSTTARVVLLHPAQADLDSLVDAVGSTTAAPPGSLRVQNGRLKVEVSLPAGYADELTTTMVNAKVRVVSSVPSGGVWVNLVLAVVPVLLIFAALLAMMRFGLLGPARSMAGARPLGQRPDTRFSDVGGVDDAVADLQEAVALLREPDKLAHLGVKVPRGYLLDGDPGTGKTLLARAVAGEAGVPFIAVSGADFVEVYAGLGARRVRDLFARARKLIQKGAPGVVIFIDEIDAVGRRRATTSHGNNLEAESTLTQLLTEMDGFRSDPILVLAATNRLEMLDEALKRPGRFDRVISVPLPDRRGRLKILTIHLGQRPVADDVDGAFLDSLSHRTSQMSGADLAQMVNDAALTAARRGLAQLDRAALEEALATARLGRQRDHVVVSDFDRRLTAWHEAGHAVAALVQPAAPDPVRVTIIPRGTAGGVTWMQGGDEVFLRRSQAHAQLVVALAGRAAEEQLLDGDFTSGPHGDLQAATSLATAMIAEWGMGDGLARRRGFAGQDLAQPGPTLAAVDDLLTDALSSARQLLCTHARLMARVAEALLVEDCLDHAALLALQAEEAAPTAEAEHGR